MSRVRNAIEFLRKFRSIQNDYKKLFAPRIENIRLKYAGTTFESDLKTILEHHIREFVVNAVLAHRTE